MAKIAAEDGYTFVEAYVMVGAIYVIFSTAFSLLFGWIERMAKRRMGIIVILGNFRRRKDGGNHDF